MIVVDTGPLHAAVDVSDAHHEECTKLAAVKPTKLYRLLGADGREVLSAEKGNLGGYRPRRIYGRLDCPSALRALAKGGYASSRVFFADEAAAVAAGYRPCAKCLPGEYRAWRNGDRSEA